MKYFFLTLTLLASIVRPINSQTLVITNFSDWANPTYAPWDGSNNGWSVSNPGAVSNQGPTGSFQFLDLTNSTVINANPYDQVSLTVDFTSLNETNGDGKLLLNLYDETFTVIQSFSFDMGSNLAGAAVTFTGVLVGNYANLSAIELATSGLSAPDLNTFSATFTNLSLTTIPEPSTYALLALGLGVLVILRRKRAQA